MPLKTRPMGGALMSLVGDIFSKCALIDVMIRTHIFNNIVIMSLPRFSFQRMEENIIFDC
ncbi:hypothetical protein SEEC0006_10539 [Salmonella enterica subsp. enterica serovar Choleraesuis str. 0006]|nr:hypothetical protein SEEC0006_10539 [Salmonella enterica subsp. enterica serovar Choleraesuis str. 0006]